MAGERVFTRAEFAARVKKKYPEYQDMNDDDLVEKIVTVYPDYKEQIADYEREYDVEKEIVNPLRESRGLQPLNPNPYVQEEAKLDAFVDTTKQKAAEKPLEFSPVNVAGVIKKLTGNPEVKGTSLDIDNPNLEPLRYRPRFPRQPVDYGPETKTPEEQAAYEKMNPLEKVGKYGERLQKRWKKGWDSISIDMETDNARAIKDPVKREKRLAEIAEKRKKIEKTDEGVRSRNFIDASVLGAAEMLPGMIRGEVAGAATGAPMAVGASMLTAGPDPTDLVTAPGAYAAGRKVGSFLYWSKQGRGMMYGSMRDQGIAHEYADPIARVAGPMYAAIEMTEVGQALHRDGGFTKKKIATTVAKIVAESGPEVAKRVLKKYGKNVAQESGEEVVQEWIAIVAEKLAAKLDPKAEDPKLKETLLETFDRSRDTLLQSIGPMAIISGVGIKADIKDSRTEIKLENENAKKAAEFKPLADEMKAKGYADDQIGKLQKLYAEKNIKKEEIEALPNLNPFGKGKTIEESQAEIDAKKAATEQAAPTIPSVPITKPGIPETPVQPATPAQPAAPAAVAPTAPAIPATSEEAVELATIAKEMPQEQRQFKPGDTAIVGGEEYKVGKQDPETGMYSIKKDGQTFLSRLEGAVFKRKKEIVVPSEGDMVTYQGKTLQVEQIRPDGTAQLMDLTGEYPKPVIIPKEIYTPAITSGELAVIPKPIVDTARTGYEEQATPEQLAVQAALEKKAQEEAAPAEITAEEEQAATEQVNKGEPPVKEDFEQRWRKTLDRGSYLDYDFPRHVGGVDMGMSTVHEVNIKAKEKYSKKQIAETIVEYVKKPIEITPEGKLILYHATAADKAIGKKGLKSGSFLTDKETVKRYGNNILRFEVDPEAVVIIDETGDLVYNGTEKLIPAKEKTQAELVKEAVAETPKTIKEVAEQLNLLEPNVRRILGVGAKEGTFTRLDKGVYVLSHNGKDTAWIEAGEAQNVLPRLVKEGKKFDMIFLDPAYFSRALIGGNRGIKSWSFIMPEQFKAVAQSVAKLAANDDTHIYLMLSGARTAQNDMVKYTAPMVEAGLKVVGEGEYQKLFKDGSPVTNVRGEIAAPERLILFTRSGQARQVDIPTNLKFRFIRPSISKSYGTEKPKELLRALILQSTMEGEHVLDPFAGSGVTGEQALEAGRKVTLVEKEPKAIEERIVPRLEGANIKEAKEAEPAAPAKKTIDDILKMPVKEAREAIRSTVADPEGRLLEKIQTTKSELRKQAKEQAASQGKLLRTNYGRGYTTNGHFMIWDKDATDRFYKEFLFTPTQGEEYYKSVGRKSGEDGTLTDKAAEAVIPTEKDLEEYNKAILQGYGPNLKEGWRKEPLAYFTDGKGNDMALDMNYYYLGKTLFPKAELRMSEDARKAAVFAENGEVKMVVMPVRIDTNPFSTKYQESRNPEQKPKGEQRAPKFQGEKNLVAIHNLSENKLIHADKMGGLAVPSIAISNKDHVLQNFGEITLIGSTDLIEPSGETRTFNADVYSPRYPRIEYELNIENRDKASKELAAISEKIGGSKYPLGGLSIESEGLKALYNDPSVQLLYLEENGKKIPIAKKKAKTPLMDLVPELRTLGIGKYDAPHEAFQHKGVKQAYEKLRKAEYKNAYDSAIADGETKRMAIKSARAAVDHYYTEEYKGKTTKAPYNPNIMHMITREVGSLEEEGQPDYYKNKDKIRELIQPETEKFQKWVDTKYADLIESEHIFAGFNNRGDRKYKPHTLENVVKHLSKDIRDAEGFNYGLGSLRATVAKEYKTLAAIQADRDSIIPTEKFEEVKAETNELFEDIINDAIKASNRKEFGEADRFLTVLKDAIKAKADIGAELEQYGFRGMDLDKINLLLNTIREMPTEYFEAKIQRAVNLNEFVGAVIPKNSPKEVRDILEKNEIEYSEYGDDENRAAKTKAFVEQLNAKRKNILFQEARTPYEGQAELPFVEQVFPTPKYQMAGRGIPKGYLVKGVPQSGGMNFSDNAGGTWAANTIRYAKEYGEFIEYIKKPDPAKTAKFDYIHSAFGHYGIMQYDDEPMTALEADTEDYKKLREALLKDGYEALEVGVETEGAHGPRLRETWILKDNEPLYTKWDLPEPKYQMAAPVFYSKLQQTITEKLPNKISAADFNNWLKGQQIKEEEIEWSGIKEYLQGKEKVEKADVLNYLKDNEIQIKEVTKGAGSENLMIQPSAVKGEWDVINQKGRVLFSGTERAEAEQYIKDEEENTKFSNWQLPGGENYREVLMILPEQDDIDVNKKANVYKSPHWSEPNVLAHFRLNDRTDQNGKKILFIEEIQSDWHQEGRKKGYQNPELKIAQDNQQKAVDELYSYVKELKTKYKTESQTIAYEKATSEEKNKYDELAEKENRTTIALRYAPQGEVPNAPFKKTWHELALKRILREAVDQGYDKIAWTTGEQQADRYDLSKQVSSIEYKKEDESHTSIVVNVIGGKTIEEKKYANNELEELVGKDLAKKIINGEGTTLHKDYAPTGVKELSGVDLKVGGEGMKGFYDQMIPSFLNKYTKKWGGKIEDTQIPEGRRWRKVTLTEAEKALANGETLIAHPDIHGPSTEIDPDITIINDKDDLKFAVENSEYLLMENPNEKNITVQSVAITPTMKESVQAGQPMFQKEQGNAARPELTRLEQAAEARSLLKRYGVDIDKVKLVDDINTPTGKAAGSYYDGVINLSLLARGTTGAHEAFHYFAENYAKKELFEAAKKEAIDQAGLAGKNLDTKAEEYLAEKFAEYRATKKVKGQNILSFFKDLIENIREVFGKEASTEKLFKSFLRGERATPGLIARARYQEYSSEGKQRYINKLVSLRKDLITEELENMANAVAAGDVRRGVDWTESTYPEWYKNIGFKNKEEAMRVLRGDKKDSVLYYRAVEEAKNRLRQGIMDSQTQEQVPPNSDFIETEKEIKDLDDRTYKDLELTETHPAERVSDEEAKTLLEKEGYTVTKEKVVPAGSVEKVLVTKVVEKQMSPEKTREYWEKKGYKFTRGITIDLAKTELEKRGYKVQAPSRKLTTKQIIERATGLEHEKKFVKMTEPALLKMKLRAAKSAAKEAEVETKKKIAEITKLKNKIKKAKMNRKKIEKRLAIMPRRLRKMMKQKRIKVTQAKQIIELIGDVSKRKDIKKYLSIMAEYERLKEEGQDTSHLPVEFLNKAAQVLQQDFHLLSDEDLTNLYAEVMGIYEEGKYIMELRKEHHAKLIDGIVTEATEDLNATNPAARSMLRTIATEELHTNSLFKKISNYWNNAKNTILLHTFTPPKLMQAMDGGEKKSMYYALFDWLKQRTGDEIIFRESYEYPLKKAMTTIYKRIGKKEFEKFKTYDNGGNPIELNAPMRIKVALYAENKRARAILENNNHILPETIDEIINDMSANEREMKDVIRQGYDRVGPKVLEMAEEVDNVPVNEEENYFNIVLKEGEDILYNEVEFKLAEAGFTPPNVAKGWTKARVEHKHPIKLEDLFGTIDRHFDQIARYYAYAPIHNDIKNILRKLRPTITNLYGNQMNKELNRWSDDVMYGEPYAVGLPEKILKWLRIRSYPAALSWNLNAALKQPLSLLNASDEIGMKYTALGLAHIKKIGLKQAVKEAHEESPFLRTRSIDPTQKEYDQVINKDLIDRYNQTGMAPLQYLDDITAVAAYEGAKMKALAEGKSEEEARKYGEQVVEETQNMGHVLYKPAYSRGGEMSKALNMYMTQAYQTLSQMYLRTIQLKNGKIGLAKYLSSYIYLVIMPGIFAKLIETFKPWDPDKDTGENLMEYITSMLEIVPILGDIISAAQYDNNLFELKSTTPLKYALMPAKLLFSKKDLNEKIEGSILYTLKTGLALKGINTKPYENAFKGAIDIQSGKDTRLRRLIKSEAQAGKATIEDITDKKELKKTRNKLLRKLNPKKARSPEERQAILARRREIKQRYVRQRQRIRELQ